MAQFNLIQRPDLNDRLVRALGIRERAPAPNLSPEVQAVILLEDLTTSSPFQRSLMRECAGIGTAGPVAGQYSAIVVSNPAGSGSVIRIDSITAWASAATRLQVGPWTQAIPAGSLSRYFLDPRFDGVPTGALRNGTNAVLGISALRSWSFAAANTAVELKSLGIIVPPGYMAGFALETQNLMLSGSMQWTEFTA